MFKVFGLATVLLLLVLLRIDDPDAASLGGRITNENHEAIVGATVSATNVFSQEVEATQSDATGFYKLVGCGRAAIPCSQQQKVTDARRFLMFCSSVDNTRNWI